MATGDLVGAEAALIESLETAERTSIVTEMLGTLVKIAKVLPPQPDKKRRSNSSAPSAPGPRATDSSSVGPLRSRIRPLSSSKS